MEEGRTNVESNARNQVPGRSKQGQCRDCGWGTAMTRVIGKTPPQRVIAETCSEKSTQDKRGSPSKGPGAALTVRPGTRRTVL